MPVYKRGPSKYCVRIYQAGKPKDWVIHGSKSDAEKFEARKRVELASQGPVEWRAAPSFSSFLTTYKLHAKQHLGALTWRNRRYTLATLGQYFGELKLDQIAPVDIATYQAARLKTVRPVVINDETRHLCTVLRYASSIGVPAIVPKYKKLPEPKTTGRVKVWSVDDVKMLYAAVQATCPRLLGMTAVLLNTGMRRGEVLALEWSWIDLERELILIQPNLYWRPKSNRPREVPLSPAIRQWLAVPPREREHATYVFCTRRQKRAQADVKERWSHAPYASWPQNQFDRAIEAAGIGGSPHVARHTFASHFLKAVPDLFLLARVLGHSHTRVTEIYSHLLPDHLAKARGAVSLPVP